MRCKVMVHAVEIEGFDKVRELDERGPYFMPVTVYTLLNGIATCRIARRAADEKLKIDYEYDFDNSWHHDVVLEHVGESESGIKYPRCIDGERACPPEDIGGVYGFAQYVEALTYPKDSENQEFLEWHGPFDPVKFVAATVSRRMKK